MPSVGAAKLLDSITASLRRGCPTVPPDLYYRIVAFSRPRSLAQIWFRTRGCRYRIQGGGCTVCDYSVSNKPTSRRMIESVAAAISELPFEPQTLVLSASGSFLDPWEVPAEARTGILRLIARRLPSTEVIIETHASTVTNETVGACVALVESERLGVELGLECTDPTALKFCLNKHLTLPSFRRALSVIASFSGVRATANILIGIPFLTMAESARSAIDTVNWAFGNCVDRCVLFPVNIRPYTLAHWLCSRALWSPPTLWDLVNVLVSVPAAVLDRVDIAWFAPSKHASPPSAETLVPPGTCPQCYDHVVTLLTRYADGLNRHVVRRELANIVCTCKVQRDSSTGYSQPLGDRLLEAYKMATLELLGPEVWQQKRAQVTEELNDLNTAENAQHWLHIP